MKPRCSGLPSAALGALLAVMSAVADAASLDGSTWIPDMETTLEYAESRGEVPQAQADLLRRSYAGLEVAFTPAEMVTRFQGRASTSTYQLMDNAEGQPAVFLGGRGRVAVEWFILEDEVLYHAIDHDYFPRVYFRRQD